MTTEEKTEPDAKTFNLAGFLSGRTFPERVVPVMVDEKLQVAYAELMHAHDNEFDTKKREELAESLKTLRDSFEDLFLRVTIRGVPVHVIDNIENEVHTEFPPKVNAFGKEVASNEAVKEFDLRLWAAFLVKLEAPDGSYSVPDVEDIKALRDGLPEASLAAIGNAINELRKDAVLGYETAATELGFLSKP